MLRLLLLAALATAASAACLDCICQQESGCKALPCKPDRGSLSCGYFQIKKNYYLDCDQVGKKPGESTDAAWKRCSLDKACSTQCVQKYFARYRKNCPGKGECEAMARLHNGGPQGCKKAATLKYWEAVKRRGCR